MIAVEDVGEAVLDHRIDQADVAHLRALAERLAVGRHRHAFLTAGDDDAAVAQSDRLRRERDGPKARAAHLVDSPSRDFLRDAGSHRRLPRRILALSGSKHLAEDYLADFFARYASVGQRRFDRDASELVGGGGCEGAEKGADRSAARGGDDDIGHVGTPKLRVVMSLAPSSQLRKDMFVAARDARD